MKTKIKLLDEKAVIPKKAHDVDTGYDLTFIGIEKIVGDVIFFKTGIALESPRGYYWEVAPCSRISKQGFSIANSFGVIDEGYRGEILVALRVHHAHAGEGIRKNAIFASGLVEFEGRRYSSMTSLATGILEKKPVLTQLILRKRYNSDFEEVSELKDSKRMAKGFGSTEQGITKAIVRKEILTNG